jgi:ABC-type transport system substrate-binding protein
MSRDTNKAAGEVVKQLAEIGLVAELDTVSDDYFDRLLAGDFALTSFNYIPDTYDSLDFLNTLFHSATGGRGEVNVNAYSNSELDGILDRANASSMSKNELTSPAKPTHC